MTEDYEEKEVTNEVRWTEIPGFEEYLVSDTGLVIDQITGIRLKPQLNETGSWYVNIRRSDGVGRTTTKAIAPLVLHAFVPKHDYEFHICNDYEPLTEKGLFFPFDTPINLNQDRTDCRAVNLMWRTRKFAIAYHKQDFSQTFKYKDEPIVDLANPDVQYENIPEVCMTFGCIDLEVAFSLFTHKYNKPTGQRFSWISDIETGPMSPTSTRVYRSWYR